MIDSRSYELEFNQGPYTFTPKFKETSLVYRAVKRVWIGDGTNSEKAGFLYAEYVDGTIEELGFVSDYEKAKELCDGNLSYEEWVQLLLDIPDFVNKVQPATIAEIDALFT